MANLIEERQIDLGFVYSEVAADRKDLCAREVLRFRPTVLISKDLMEGKTDDEVLKALPDIPFSGHLHYKLSEEDSRKEARVLLQSMKVQAKSVTVYNSMEDSLAYVEMGECFTSGNEMLPVFYSPHLRHIPLEWNASLVCAWHKGNTDPIALRKNNHMVCMKSK